MGELVTGMNRRANVEYRAFETYNLFGQKYQKKTEHGSGFLQCVFCGRDTSKQGKSQGVMVGAGGALIVHPDDYQTLAIDGGEMGWFPVGAECIKEVPAEFRVVNIYDNKVKGV
jgi:hypothetical protein